VLVVVLLSLVDLLSKSSLITDKRTKNIDINRLKEHTSKLTPKVLIAREHGHHAGIDGLTNSLLLNLGGNCNGLRGSNRLRSSNRLGRLGLRLVGRTTVGGLTVVEVTRILRLTRSIHALSISGIHVGREVEECRIHRLAVHASHDRIEALLAVLRLKHGTTITLLLSKSKVKRLAVEEVVHCLLDSLKGTIVAGEIAETKALAATVGISHDDAALDSTIGAQESTEIIISNGISQVTDVHVSLGNGGSTVEVVLVLDGGLMFGFLLSTANVKRENSETVLLELLSILIFFNRTNKRIVLPLEKLLVHSGLSLNSIFVFFEVNKTEATAHAILVSHDDRRSDVTKFLKHLTKILSSEVGTEVLHVQVGVCSISIASTHVLGDELLASELLTESLELVLVSLAGFEGSLRILDLGKLDETIAKAGTIILGLNLGGRNSTKVRENIVKINKSNTLVEVFNIQVTLTALTLRGITARPHDTAGLTLQTMTIESIKSLLGILRVLEVDVSITKRMLILNITANTDRKDGTTILEGIVDIRFTDIRTKITDIKGVAGIHGGRGDSGSGRNRLFSRHF